MKDMTLNESIEMAQNLTAQAKAVKSWRLRKADRNLQALDMPKGYILATGSEVYDILVKAGKKVAIADDDIKSIWALSADIRPDKNGKVELSLMPIKTILN